MGLYPKQLNGLKDLQLEKQKLREARKELTLTNIFNAEIEELKNRSSGNGVLGTLVSLLASDTVLEFAFNLVPSIVNKFTRKRSRRKAEQEEDTDPADTTFEIVDLASRGIQLFMRLHKNREHKEN